MIIIVVVVVVVYVDVVVVAAATDAATVLVVASAYVYVVSVQYKIQIHTSTKRRMVVVVRVVPVYNCIKAHSMSNRRFTFIRKLETNSDSLTERSYQPPSEFTRHKFIIFIIFPFRSILNILSTVIG